MSVEALKNTSLDNLAIGSGSRRLIFHVIGSALLAVIVTLVFWALLPSSLRQNDSTDYSFYYEPLARNILHGDGFVRQDGSLITSNPPGYPILLAGIFTVAQIAGLSEDFVHSVFVLLCMGLSSIFVFLLSEKFWGTRGAWLSALFFMTYPFALWLTKQPSTEIPFMAVFYAGFYLFWVALKRDRNRWLLLFFAGICMGLAMLVRGIAFGSGVLLCSLFLLLNRDTTLKMRLLLVLALFAGNTFAIFPWQAWLYGRTGQMILLGTNGASSIKDGLTFAVQSKNYRAEIAIPADVTKLQEELVIETDSMRSLTKIFETLGRHFLEKPWSVLKLFLIKAGRSWFGTDSGRMEPMILAVQLFYAVVVLLATAAVWRLRHQYSDLLWFVWVPVFYFWLMTTLVLSILRYMTPTIGLVSLLIPGLLHFIPYRLHRFASS